MPKIKLQVSPDATVYVGAPHPVDAGVVEAVVVVAAAAGVVEVVGGVVVTTAAGVVGDADGVVDGVVTGAGVVAVFPVSAALAICA